MQDVLSDRPHTSDMLIAAYGTLTRCSDEQRNALRAPGMPSGRTGNDDHPTIRYVTIAAIQATRHCQRITAAAHRLPSSLRIEATAATQGV